MKTPKNFNQNLKSKIITKDMLGICLYSVNKRAKNCRDKEKAYRKYYHNNTYYYDKYNNIESYASKKEMYYAKKDELLSIIKPNCIHKVTIVNQHNESFNKYFKFYNLGNYSFHQPIVFEDLDLYRNLEVIDIGYLNTYGHHITDLISVQFVDKVISLIESGDFKYVA